MATSQEEREEAAKIIENFLDGRGGTWDWDEFISVVQFKNKRVQEIQALCTMASIHYPTKSGWCNEEGMAKMREYAHELRSVSETTTANGDPA